MSRGSCSFRRLRQRFHGRTIYGPPVLIANTQRPLVRCHYHPANRCCLAANGFVPDSFVIFGLELESKDSMDSENLTAFGPVICSRTPFWGTGRRCWYCRFVLVKIASLFDTVNTAESSGRSSSLLLHLLY